MQLFIGIELCKNKILAQAIYKSPIYIIQLNLENSYFHTSESFQIFCGIHYIFSYKNVHKTPENVNTLGMKTMENLN